MAVAIHVRHLSTGHGVADDNYLGRSVRIDTVMLVKGVSRRCGGEAVLDAIAIASPPAWNERKLRMGIGRVERFIALENAVGKDEELAHDRDKRDDLRLAGRDEPLIEGLGERVKSYG
jgi:hypothetical protein